MTENARMIFNKLCAWECHWESNNVYSVRLISEAAKLTKYAVRKAIAELREMGLVQRTCVGCPAVESSGEYVELVCEAMPPMHGFGLTDLARQSDIYKEAEKAFDKSMREWAEGKEDGDDYGTGNDEDDISVWLF